MQNNTELNLESLEDSFNKLLLLKLLSRTVNIIWLIVSLISAFIAVLFIYYTVITTNMDTLTLVKYILITVNAIAVSTIAVINIFIAPIKKLFTNKLGITLISLFSITYFFGQFDFFLVILIIILIYLNYSIYTLTAKTASKQFSKAQIYKINYQFSFNEESIIYKVIKYNKVRQEDGSLKDLTSEADHLLEYNSITQATIFDTVIIIAAATSKGGQYLYIKADKDDIMKLLDILIEHEVKVRIIKYAK